MTQDRAPISDTMHMELSTTDFIANALENKPLGADPVELLRKMNLSVLYLLNSLLKFLHVCPNMPHPILRPICKAF